MKLSDLLRNSLPFLLLILVLGCGSQPGVRVNTGTTAANTSGTEKPAIIRRATLNQTKNFNGLEITIGEVAIERDKITVGVTIQNTSKDPIMFYPNQHSVVIGKKQLDATFLNNGTEISGEIHPGIERSSPIVFEEKAGSLEPSEIKMIGLRWGNVTNAKSYKSAEVNWDLDIPEKPV